jgi:hypothetical protein
MTRTVIAGAWYGDYLPSGAFCATVPRSHIQTHLGIVPLPPGESFGIGYPRCTDIGGFRFAGQAHDTLNPAAWERIGASWRAIAPPCLGVNPTIYDALGVLHSSDGSVGSQGYRYCTPANVLVTGDATYGPFHGLFEYTQLADDLWIGQGADDGTGVRVLQLTLDAAARAVWTLRQLELGTCTFVRANRVDETVAIAFSKPEGVHLVMTSMAELRALPIVATTPKPPPVDPVKPKEPLPVFEPIRLPDEAQAIVEALYLRHKDLAHSPEDAQRRVLTGKIAEQVRFTLGSAWGWKKSAGPPSKDSIAKREGAVVHGFDLFNGTTRLPNDRPFSTDLSDTSIHTFIEMPPINHLGAVIVTPPPPPPPPPPSPTVGVTHAELKEAIASVLDKCVLLIAAQTPAPVDVGPAVEAALRGYEVNGKTGRDRLGLQHDVKLPIAKRQA